VVFARFVRQLFPIRKFSARRVHGSVELFASCIRTPRDDGRSGRIDDIHALRGRAQLAIDAQLKIGQ